MAAMKDTTKNMITYLQGLAPDANVTAKDVADALGMSVQSVNGTFTAAVRNKGYGERVEAEIELDDGSHQKVKFLKLNAEGRALDVNAEPVAAE